MKETATSRIGSLASRRSGIPYGVVAGGLMACLGLTGAPRALQAESKPSPPPMEVTTDTPEYCSQLADRVNSLVEIAATKPPQQVAYLQVEGKRMCEQGQTRGGIMRLRQAILLMKHDGAPAGP
jgi:hypothetical protein